MVFIFELDPPNPLMILVTMRNDWQLAKDAKVLDLFDSKGMLKKDFSPEQILETPFVFITFCRC